MKIYTIDHRGLSVPKTTIIKGKDRLFHGIVLGTRGEHTTQYVLALDPNSFPVRDNKPIHLTGNYKLTVSKKTSKSGRLFFIIKPLSEPTDDYLFIFDTSPGRFGFSDYVLTGRSSILLEIERHDGHQRSRRLSHVSLIHTTGDSVWSWNRTGKKEEPCQQWSVVIENHKITIAPKAELEFYRDTGIPLKKKYRTRYLNKGIKQ